MASPRILLHDNPAQKKGCLESLVRYAYQIERTAFAKEFSSLDSFVAWMRMQPVKLDRGEAPQGTGCSPSQRQRIWPTDGFNCWEATAHFLAIALALQVPEIVHLYDVTRGGQRHVWPELQDPLQLKNPVPVVLQPALEEGLRAQGFSKNTVADVSNAAGSAALSAWGLGSLSPLIESLWSFAPEEYGLSKNVRPKDAPDGTPGASRPSSIPTPEIQLDPEIASVMGRVELSPQERTLLSDPALKGLVAKLSAAQSAPPTKGTAP